MYYICRVKGCSSTRTTLRNWLSVYISFIFTALIIHINLFIKMQRSHWVETIPLKACLKM